MSELRFTKAEADISAYEQRNQSRKKTLLKATMGLVGYFMGLGDDQLTAEGNVKQMSAETMAETYIYIMGNTQPLIDKVNASTLTFMDASAKAWLTAALAPPV